MKGLNWSLLAALVVLLCHYTTAAPSLRIKRQDELTLDPINADDAVNDVDREKRKLPEATFQSKNAVLGFVFGKINQFIDAKTRLVDQLDRGNIEKNIQHNIPTPVPVPSFQALISGIITPKISALTQTFGSLSGSFLGGSSGGSSGGNGGNDDGSSGGSAAGGLGGIVSSVLRLSGPIISASSGGSGGGLSGGGSIGATNSASQASAAGAGTASRFARQGIFGTRAPIQTTTDDTPDFDRSKVKFVLFIETLINNQFTQQVSLEIPDGLFGSSFTTVTNISKIVGDLITSTSRRTAQLFWVFKPLFGNALKIEIPEPTTTTTESSS
ncbi:unnamed protein product [Diamesa tonsa]